MPFPKGEHELPGFVEGFDFPAVGEGEGLHERTRQVVLGFSFRGLS